ncbi:MAG: KH domain-containing protein [Bacilli bacterium]
MDLVALTESIVLSLVSDKESVKVKQLSEDDNTDIVIQVLVSEIDMGKLIGKGGKTANAIRTIVQASSYLKDNKRININIDHF